MNLNRYTIDTPGVFAGAPVEVDAHDMTVTTNGIFFLRYDVDGNEITVGAAPLGSVVTSAELIEDAQSDD